MAVKKSSGVTSREVEVTPAIAEDWLGRNSHNRSLRNRRVAELAGAMRRGEWMVGQPIMWDNNGVLLDGQHRLWAVVESGCTVPMLVVEGLSPDTQLTIDLTARRNLNDTLRLMKHSDATQLGAVIGFKWRWDNHYRRQPTMKPSVIEGLQVLTDHPDLVDALKMAKPVFKRLRTSAAVSGGLAYEFSNVDPDAATEFFDTLATGIGLKANSPLTALRKHFEQHLSSRGEGQVMQTALMIKAWNAWMAGEECQRLFWRSVGSRSEDFPEIAVP